MAVRIIQIMIEVDGQLCHVKIPDGIEPILLELLKDDDGKIAAIKLPDSVKKVSMKYLMQ